MSAPSAPTSASRRIVRALHAARRAARPYLRIRPRRGLALVGTVWTGGASTPTPGALLLDSRGRFDVLHPSTATLPDDTVIVGGAGCWVGPALIDTHVHLAFGAPEPMRNTGLLAVRDLGAPFGQLRALSDTARRAAVRATFSGPIITAPGGYPTTSWGADGFGIGVSSAEYAVPVVEKLAERGAAVIKVALEDSGGLPPLGPTTLRAVVARAHELGLAVIAHALSAAMVARAVDAEVDELAHMPTERLPDELVERLAERQVAVSSTLQTHFAEGRGADAARNAKAFVKAGVPLLYGTDLGNTATTPGVDPRELDRIAQAGLGRLGALRAATCDAAAAAGIRASGMLARGDAVDAVVLAENPLTEPATWRAPVAVFARGNEVA
ncbi:amidohydrolase family protein [Epidermidibacterium keratini]|uniref:Amidohydrolase family protein n=1 Tax=Epidermidibacterium keratini TaxID=1891644 RepID=A0A7L4YJP4_9ACTN|nr:amidohydrolase family protein [Epidermidibacterium keratini]QHB99122.1 amidohydrolase family protein [Epidermidibacterium keratini]